MNGAMLRGILVPVLLVSLAEMSSAIELKEVRFAARLDDKMQAVDPGNEYAPDATVYLSAAVEGRPKNGILKCRFSYRDQLITEAAIDFAQANKGLLFSIGESTNVGFHLTHDNPFPVSQHFRADLFHDDKMLGSYAFHVVPPKDAGPTRLHAATLAHSVDDNFRPVKKSKEFKPGDTVHLAVEADVGLSTWIQADWFVAGKHDSSGTRALTFQENATKTGLAFSFIPKGGWPKGTHRVVLTINDEKSSEQKFTVAAPAEVKPKPSPKPAPPRQRGMRKKKTPPASVANPKTASEFNARGEEHYEAQRYDEALADISEALRLDPDNAEYMSNRGWVFYELDDSDTALLEFDEAIKLDRNLMQAWWGRAVIFSDDEEWAEAVVAYSHAIRSTTDRTEQAELYVERGKARYRSGDFDRALKDFERAISRDPEYAWAYANRAELLSEAGDHAGAIDALNQAIELDDEAAEFHSLLGSAWEDAGELESAVEAYTAAILLDLNNISFYQSRARVHERNGDPDKAVKDLKRAISIDPTDPVSHNNLGLVYGNAGEFEVGIQELNTALELDDSNPIFWFNRGELRFQNGDTEAADGDLTQSLELDPEDPDAWALRGRIRSQLGNSDAALRDYNQAVTLGPDTYHHATEKYLRIANRTDEKLHVWVQYFTDKWHPPGAIDEGTAAQYEFVPDEEDALIHNQIKIHGSRFHIWAVGLESGREYVEFRSKEFVPVPEAGYITTDGELESATFVLAPAGKMAPKPTPPSPSPSPGSDRVSQQPLPRSSTIHAVAYGEQDGKSFGVCFPVEVTVDKNPTETIETAFELSDAGNTWRAAGWMATVFAADTVGWDPLATQVRFATNQNIDGPSAGGLMTVGVLATLRGDPIRQDAAMTGTINPDGTIGPVGGIPHKMEGAAATGKKLFLTPYGKRYEKDKNADKHVDLFAHGRELGLDVHAVGDVYSAYELLTGVRLPRPEPARAPQLDVDMYDRVVQKVVGRYSQYESYVAAWKRLPVRYRTEDGTSLISDAKAAADRVDGLLNEGQAPAAFQDAINAAQQAAVAVELTRTLQKMDQRGIDAGKAYLRGFKVEQQWQEAVNALRQYQPETLSGVGVVMHGYSTLLQGMALQEVGEQLLDGRFSFPLEGSSTDKTVISVLMASAYLQIARMNYENIAEVLDIAAGVRGRSLGEDAPYFSTTMFFKNAAVANMNQFEQVIVRGRAKASQVPFETMQTAMMQRDQAYLITRFSMDHSLPKLLKELDEDPALIYAHLGSALQVYVMASRLLSEYYSLSVIHDENGNITGIVSESPLKYMLDFSEDAVRRNIQLLRDNDVEPMSSVFFCQVGSSLRSRELKDRLGALTSFWQANVQARTLAYLGGFAVQPE